MVYKGATKFVSAQHMADQIKTKQSANTRILKLLSMIEGEEEDIKTAQITIKKHQKEIRLLKEKFNIESESK